MDSYPRSREVEKVKTFEQRAIKASLELGYLRESVRRLSGHDTDLEAALRRAKDLLEEAVRRGVKGKEPHV